MNCLTLPRYQITLLFPIPWTWKKLEKTFKNKDELGYNNILEITWCGTCETLFLTLWEVRLYLLRCRWNLMNFIGSKEPKYCQALLHVRWRHNPQEHPTPTSPKFWIQTNLLFRFFHKLDSDSVHQVGVVRSLSNHVFLNFEAIFFYKHHTLPKELKRKSLYFSENISCLGALAISIPQLDNFISLIGAIASAALALIFPPILNTMCFWNHGISKFEIVKNISISLFGIVGAMTGTFISIEAIIIGFTTYKGDLIVREGMVGEFYQIVLNDTLTWLWWEKELAVVQNIYFTKTLLKLKLLYAEYFFL